MGQFIINGGKPLSGEITVSGSKNAALPIIFSSMLIDGVTVLSNVPEIGDVDVALDILRAFGARILRTADKLSIDTSRLIYTVPSEELVSKIRASSYLLGATLGRFGIAQLQRFGGCNFDNRPIDMHLYAACALGAELSGNTLTAKGLFANDIHFGKISVGATVNAIIMAVSANGVTKIFGYAKEPHVISLIEFFRTAGVRIDISYDHITVYGKRPRSASFSIIPDMIEAGTYIVLTLLTRSEIKVKGAALYSQLESFLMPLVQSGAVVEHGENFVTASADITEPLSIVTAPYPEYPTDLHPQAVPLMAAYCGGEICEGVWQSRFSYLEELAKFGVEYEASNGSARIKRSRIRPAHAKATDLRGGAALLLAALYTSGESIITESEIIKRGYGNIVQKLRALGADISEA